MSSIRQNKVASLIQRELANYFLQQARMKYHGAMITVTTVRVTPDLALARVYVSIFGGAEPKEKVFETIRKTTKDIRTHFANETKGQMRATPQFEFLVDDSIDYANEIDRLLKKK